MESLSGFFVKKEETVPYHVLPQYGTIPSFFSSAQIALDHIRQDAHTFDNALVRLLGVVQTQAVVVSAVRDETFARLAITFVSI